MTFNINDTLKKYIYYNANGGGVGREIMFTELFYGGRGSSIRALRYEHKLYNNLKMRMFSVA